MSVPESTLQLIDTHCHLDAAEFDADRDAVALAAQENGVARIVVPAVERANFDTVVQLSQRLPLCAMAKPPVARSANSGCTLRRPDPPVVE